VKNVDFERRQRQERNTIEQRLTSPTVSLVLGGSIVGAVVYLFFLFQPSFRGDPLPYAMALLAEFFLISQAVLAFWTIRGGRNDPRQYEYHDSQNSLFGDTVSKAIVKSLHKYDAEDTRNMQLYLHREKLTVDVFVPVYGEPVEEIKETAIAARDMYGRHGTYILDDGDSDEVKEMANEVGVRYIRRPTHEHAKAGNINYALSKTTADFFVILDADFVAKKDFLYETLPFFESQNLAMVQTPQYYSNTNNFVSKGAGYMQHVFYAMIMAGKNHFNAAFCVGTCVVFRRSAIREVGGMYEKSKSEDIWTSLRLHEEGWQTVYINKVLAEGKTPETLKAYSKQQLRWATGSFEIFLGHNPLLNKKLTIDQRLQYFMTTSFYFNGFAILLLLFLPVLQIFFNLSPVSLSIPAWQYALLYSGYFFMQLLLSFYAMGGLKIQTVIISGASFPIYIKAFFNALIGRDQAWSATNSRDSSYDSPFNYIRMQTYFFLLMLLTTIVGIWKVFYTDEFSISVVWAAVLSLILGYFVFAAIREAHILRRESRAEGRRRKSLRVNVASSIQGAK
jgi:cellulose synthase (UDP-forming)